MTDADRCRLNGWGPGTVLVGTSRWPGGEQTEAPPLTAVGEAAVLARGVAFRAETGGWSKRTAADEEECGWTLADRDWLPASPDDLAALRAAGADLPPEHPAPPPADEVRAAAGRYGNPDPAAAYPWPCETHEQPLRRSLDTAVLARIYLVANPPDGDEPVTADWLRWQGWGPTECRRPRYNLRVGQLGGYDSWQWETADALRTGRNGVWLYRWADRNEFWAVFPDGHPDGDPHEVALPDQPTTRGAVRRLLAALGVPAKE